MSSIAALASFTTPPIQQPKQTQPPVDRDGDHDAGATPKAESSAKAQASGLNVVV